MAGEGDGGGGGGGLARRLLQPCGRCRGGLCGMVFGGHDIGWLGGVALLTNTILGSGMVQIPSLFAASGWLAPTAVFAAAAAATAVAALLLARAVASAARGAGGERAEYSRLMGGLLPRGAARAGMLLLVAAFIAQNISNIVLSAQVADDALLAVAHRTCALVLYRDPAQAQGPAPPSPWLCIAADDDAIVTDSPFGPGVYALSIGFLAVAALTVPLSYLPLDSNIVFQIGGVAAIIVCELIWLANFAVLGLSAANLPVTAPPAAGGWLAAYSNVLPTVLYNFGFVAAIPSWLNEKGPGVSATSSIVASVLISTALYLALGFVGAASTLDFSGGSDLLSLLINTDGVWTASKVAVFIFPAANCMTSIPVFCLLVRYNLVNEGWASPAVANVIGVGMPWVLSLVFYAGNQLAELVNWSAAICFALINLVIPLVLYLRQRATQATAASAGAVTGLAAAMLEDVDDAKRAAVGASRIGSAFVDADGDAPLLLSDYAGATSAINAAWGSGETGEDLRVSAAAGDALEDEDIRPSSACFRRYVLGDTRLALVLLAASVVTAIAALALQIYQEVQADTGGGGSR